MTNPTSSELDLKKILDSFCKECDGKGYIEFGGMAMEDDLVEQEPCDNKLHSNAIRMVLIMP